MSILTIFNLGSAYAVTEEEAAWYYFGIGAPGEKPVLLYRTSGERTPWSAPTGRIARSPQKFARAVYGTPLNRVWDTVGPLIDDLVYTAVKRSYSIVTARFLTVPDGESTKDGTLGPVVICISVDPGSTPVDTAHNVSQEILLVLADHGLDGVDVEWSESITSRLTAPALLENVNGDEDNPTTHVRRHLTTALSIPIAAAGTKNDAQGTVGFYFHEKFNKCGSPSNKVLAVTNHHVLCTVDDKTYDFRASSSPSQKVQVCGSRRFQQGLDEIAYELTTYRNTLEDLKDSITDLVATIANGDRSQHSAENLSTKRRKLDQCQASIDKLEQFRTDINATWGDIANRSIGVLEYSPPLTVDVDNERYTQDWATIRLDAACFEPNFRGNVIDLGAF